MLFVFQVAPSKREFLFVLLFVLNKFAVWTFSCAFAPKTAINTSMICTSGRKGCVILIFFIFYNCALAIEKRQAVSHDL